jgi:hypothetical protein
MYLEHALRHLRQRCNELRKELESAELAARAVERQLNPPKVFLVRVNGCHAEPIPIQRTTWWEATLAERIIAAEVRKQGQGASPVPRGPRWQACQIALERLGEPSRIGVIVSEVKRMGVPLVEHDDDLNLSRIALTQTMSERSDVFCRVGRGVWSLVTWGIRE